MNFIKNIKLISSVVLLVLLAIFAGACQTANTNSAHTTTSNHGSNSAAHDNSMSANTANMSNKAAHAGHDMSGMGHGEMTSDPNAASQPYDLQFIDTMSAHHQGAVEMAETVLRKSDNDELKKFARKIIDDQKKEIAQMKDWREKWYAGKPAAKNMEMTGMADSMKMMSGDDMTKWEAAAGKDFDVQFLDMMTPHHVGAVVMAREALQKSEHPEIKTLANNIIKAQESEIKMMSDWKAKWQSK